MKNVLLMIVLVGVFLTSCSYNNSQIRVVEGKNEISEMIKNFNNGNIEKIKHPRLKKMMIAIQEKSIGKLEDMGSDAAKFLIDYPDEFVSIEGIALPGPRGLTIRVNTSYVEESEGGSILCAFKSEQYLVWMPIEKDPDKDKTFKELQGLYGYELYSDPKCISDPSLITDVRTGFFFFKNNIREAEFRVFNSDNEKAGRIIVRMADEMGNSNGVATPYEILNLSYLYKELAQKFPQEVDNLINTSEWSVW
jgi:hypothetical protein